MIGQMAAEQNSCTCLSSGPPPEMAILRRPPVISPIFLKTSALKSGVSMPSLRIAILVLTAV